MEASEPVPTQPFPCTECASGLMHLRFITYFTWLNDELITVPNFPAWICDVCGRREYDGKAVSMLTMLLNPETGHPAEPKRVAPRGRTRPIQHRPRPDQS